MLKLVALLSLLLISGASYAETKLACVDTNRILQESKLVAEAQAELREKLMHYQKELSKKEQKLEELKKQIDSKAISKKTKEEKIKEYQKVEAQARELQGKAQQELNEIKQRLETMVYNRVKEAAEKLAKKKGFSGIVDCGVFVYKESSLDVTTEIIKLVDTGVSKK